MKRRHVPGYTQSFIVRIWYEETGNKDSAIERRGSVERIGSRKRLFFHQLDDILTFIDEQSKPPRDKPCTGTDI